jgi:hypothetical protein
MKKYKVLLARDYIEVNARNKNEARECAEFFISGETDTSTEKDRKQYNFEIVRIKPVRNDAFEVEELT